MERLFLLLATLFVSVVSTAQSITPSVLNHAGFDFQQGEFTASISIGEFAVTTLASPTGIITQGFLQPVRYNPCTDVQIRYYPNPVKDEIIVEALGCESKIESIEFFNVWGQQLSQIVRAKNNKIEFGSYAPGVYFMKVNLSIGQAELIKIIKVSN